MLDSRAVRVRHVVHPNQAADQDPFEAEVGLAYVVDLVVVPEAENHHAFAADANQDRGLDHELAYPWDLGTAKRKRKKYNTDLSIWFKYRRRRG